MRLMSSAQVKEAGLCLVEFRCSVKLRRGELCSGMALFAWAVTYLRIGELPAKTPW